MAGPGDGPTAAFAALQARLEACLALNTPDSSVDHVLIALPSFSVGESLLSHYVERIPALEHRYLLAALMLPRIERCELIFICSQAPSSEIVDHLLAVVPPERRADARARLHVFEVPDRSARAVASKLLDRPDLVAGLRALIGERPALIEPWNVTDDEVRVALALDAPINGTAPELWPLGFKSAGRRLFRDAGVPMAPGREDVRSVDDVVAAVAALRSGRPALAGVVIKLDDSGAGDGNVVVDLRSPEGLTAALAALPEWFVSDLAGGGVVEELISGTRFSSPSAQVDLRPDGTVNVLSTHEQVLGGAGSQVYMGCRFPADPAYAAELAQHARAVGAELARRGAVGRAGVDFAAARDAAGRWEVFALETNLRKGGTTHPFAALRNLVPGRYDADAGRWEAADGSGGRWYHSTDNLVDPAWLGLAPAVAAEAVADAGLRFDPRAGVGVVLHMLVGLAIDGRLGLTAIGRDADEAEDLYERTAAAINEAAGRSR